MLEVMPRVAAAPRISFSSGRARFPIRLKISTVLALFSAMFFVLFAINTAASLPPSGAV
jgi:hypothetical protein